MIRDPRSEAEKARGETSDLARKEARDLAAARKAEPLEEDDGDSTGTGSIPPSGRVPVYPDESETKRPDNDEDILSRAKE